MVALLELIYLCDLVRYVLLLLSLGKLVHQCESNLFTANISPPFVAGQHPNVYNGGSFQAGGSYNLLLRAVVAGHGMIGF